MRAIGLCRFLIATCAQNTFTVVFSSELFVLQYKRFNTHFERAIRDDSGKYRIYRTPSGVVYPSVTSVIGKTKSDKDRQKLQSWKDNEPHSDYIVEESIQIGTQTHQLIEDYLDNKPTTVFCDLLANAHFERLKPFLHKITEIHGIEEKLYSDELKLAGTADAVCMYNGNLSIVDYKTKRSDQKFEYLNDYFLQGTAYCIMWEERTGIAVNQIVILVSSRKGQLQEFIVDPNNYKSELKQRILEFE